MKMTIIEEAKDLSSIEVDELIGSIQTFDMSINERSEKKNKCITFVSNFEEGGSQDVKEESLTYDIYLLRKKLNKNLKYLNRKWRTIVPYKRFNIISHNKDMNKLEPNSGKGTRCLECEGYGHLRAERSTFLKNQKKRSNVIFSESDDERE